MKLPLSILLITCWTACAQSNLMPDIAVAKAAAAKAKGLISSRTNSSSSAVVVVSNPPPALPTFTNNIPLKFSTATVPWLEILEYTDDRGSNWHHMTPSLIASNNETFSDTKATASRWYMLVYTPARASKTN